jgi:hypothetical protein
VTTPRTYATWTYDITGADVLDVIRWAQDEAGADRMFAVALVRDDLEHGDDVRRRGLVWIMGTDANHAPADRIEQARRDGMWRRRGRQVVTADERLGIRTRGSTAKGPQLDRVRRPILLRCVVGWCGR